VLPGTYDDYFGNLKHKNWDLMDDVRDMHILTTKVPTYKKINGQWVYCYKWGGRVRVRFISLVVLPVGGSLRSTVRRVASEHEAVVMRPWLHTDCLFVEERTTLTSVEHPGNYPLQFRPVRSLSLSLSPPVSSSTCLRLCLSHRVSQPRHRGAWGRRCRPRATSN
jgi:hypothetical protein